MNACHKLPSSANTYSDTAQIDIIIRTHYPSIFAYSACRNQHDVTWHKQRKWRRPVNKGWLVASHGSDFLRIAEAWRVGFRVLAKGKTMQSLAVYGRLLARAVVSGLNNEFALPQGAHPSWSPSTCSQCTFSRPLHLVTAASGLGKSQSPAQIMSRWSFGDDACFIAAQKLADVVGKWSESWCPPNDPCGF